MTRILLDKGRENSRPFPFRRKDRRRLGLKKEVEVSVARYLRTPPEGANPQGLIRDYRAALSSETCLSIVVVGNYKFSPITVVQCRVQRTAFQRPSTPFHPHQQPTATSGLLVEVAVSKPRPVHLLRSRFSTIAVLRRHHGYRPCEREIQRSRGVPISRIDLRVSLRKVGRLASRRRASRREGRL